MKLVNKIIIICALLIMFINNTIYAVNYKTMSIEVPSEFTKLSDYYYQTGDGEKTINIGYKEESINITEPEMYTEENLKIFLDSIEKETLATLRDGVRERMEDVYGKIDDEAFDTLYNDISFDINSSEITNIGMDNYRVFKFEAVLETLDIITYEELYAIFTKTGLYNVCIASVDKSYFNSDEYISMINSIEISNPLSKSTFSMLFDWEEAMEGAAEGFLTALILIPFGYFLNKNDEKNNKDNHEKKHKNNNLKIWKLLGTIILSIISSDIILMFLLGDSISGVPAVILIIICTIPFYYFYKFLFGKKEKSKNTNIEDTTEKTVWTSCKVCGKSIPINENETCEECHQKILKRIEIKEEDANIDKKEVIENKNLEKHEKEIDEEILICEKCGKQVDREDLFCTFCGTEIIKNDIEYCTKCGSEVKKDWKFCKKCGEKLD